MRYVISYDLVDQPTVQDYHRVSDLLIEMGARRVLLSQWVLRAPNTSAVALGFGVQRALRANDRLLVTCLDSGAWWSRNLLVNPDAI